MIPAPTLAAVALGLVSSLAAQEAAPLPVERPNLLLVVADDLGVDRVAAYGAHPDPPSTPHLDSLAADGVLFENAWSAPVCSPSRAMLLTGRRNFELGVGHALPYATYPIELSTHWTSVADVLGEQGYARHLVGKWHLSAAAQSGLQHPLAMGFEHVAQSMAIGPPWYPPAYWAYVKNLNGGSVRALGTYAATDKVDDVLRLAAQSSEPWFCWLAFDLPHDPFHAPPAQLHNQRLPAQIVGNEPLFHRAMVEALDSELGRLLNGLDPAVRARTVVVFVGDNGTPQAATDAPFLPAHAKGTLYEGGIHVPLIVQGPGVARGQRCEALVMLADLYATLAELGGSEAPAQAPSRSLRAHLADPSLPSLHAIIDAGSFSPSTASPPYVDLSWAARNQAGIKLIQRRMLWMVTSEELYDLQADPFEQHNLLPLGPGSPPELLQAHAQLRAHLAGFLN